MSTDSDAGALCPRCDAHDDCADFPCTGDDEVTCTLRAA
jgi:hypothetical protein